MPVTLQNYLPNHLHWYERSITLPLRDRTLVFLSNPSINPVLPKHFRRPADTHRFRYLITNTKMKPAQTGYQQGGEALLGSAGIAAGTDQVLFLTGYLWRGGLQTTTQEVKPCSLPVRGPLLQRAVLLNDGLGGQFWEGRLISHLEKWCGELTECGVLTQIAWVQILVLPLSCESLD